MGKSALLKVAVHLAPWSHILHDPDVAADDRALSNGDAAQDGRPGVDGRVVLDDGVAGDALDQMPVLALGKALGPRVTPWYKRTFLPMMQVSPMTVPVPWSMKKDSPMVAPGWMSMPVAECAISVMMRGIRGTPRR